MSKNFLTLWIVTTAALCFAQESSKADISTKVNGLFPSYAEDNGLAQKASSSAGVLARFRSSAARLATFEFNYAHAQDTQYFTIAGAGLQSSVHTAVREVTGAYVLNLPWRPARLEPFVLVGTGIMQFNPTRAGTSVPERSLRPSQLSCGEPVSITTSLVTLPALGVPRTVLCRT